MKPGAITEQEPSDVGAQLRRVRDLEVVAAVGAQRERARRGTANLISAVHAAGWTYVQIAAELNVSVQAVSQRVKRHHPDTTPALPRLDHPVASDGPGLSTMQAWLFAGVHKTTLARWRRDGLLPRTVRDERGHWAYSRADLQQLLDHRGEHRRLPTRSGLNRANKTAVVE